MYHTSSHPPPFPRGNAPCSHLSERESAALILAMLNIFNLLQVSFSANLSCHGAPQTCRSSTAAKQLPGSLQPRATPHPCATPHAHRFHLQGGVQGPGGSSGTSGGGGERAESCPQPPGRISGEDYGHLVLRCCTLERKAGNFKHETSVKGWKLMTALRPLKVVEILLCTLKFCLSSIQAEIFLKEHSWFLGTKGKILWFR